MTTMMTTMTLKLGARDKFANQLADRMGRFLYCRAEVLSFDPHGAATWEEARGFDLTIKLATGMRPAFLRLAVRSDWAIATAHFGSLQNPAVMTVEYQPSSRSHRVNDRPYQPRLDADWSAERILMERMVFWTQVAYDRTLKVLTELFPVMAPGEGNPELILNYIRRKQGRVQLSQMLHKCAAIRKVYGSRDRLLDALRALQSDGQVRLLEGRSGGWAVELSNWPSVECSV